MFVYLAGHGTVVGSSYYYLPHDADADDLEQSCVPLTEIKSLFDKTKSRRAFLWLDFCHSGGILARSGLVDEASVIERTLEVVQGQGKVIVAACTSSQSAYESSTIGHGLFTEALLRGLRGEAKSAQGEVTVASLYDFIDHQVKHTRQQPVFFGEMTGRIVLMHYANRAGLSTKKAAAKKKSKPKATTTAKKTSGTWVMLGENFLVAEKIRHHSDGTIELVLVPQSGEDEAAIAALRPTRFGSTGDLPYAANNDASQVRVEEVVSETVKGKQVWSVSLKTVAQQSGFATEVNVQGIEPDEIARRRVERILLNDPPPQSSRGVGDSSFIEGFISGSMTGFEIKECIVRSMYRQHGQSTAWKEFARLKSIYLMKMTGTVAHILKFSIGAISRKRIKVVFRGRRPARYSNVAPETIDISGYCLLE